MLAAEGQNAKAIARLNKLYEEGKITKGTEDIPCLKWYYIVSNDDNIVLSIRYGSKTVGADLIVEQKNKCHNQHFRINLDGSISVRHSDQFLGITEGEKEYIRGYPKDWFKRHKKIIQCDQDSSDKTNFVLDRCLVNNYGYIKVNNDPLNTVGQEEYYLDIKGGSIEPGTQVIAYKFHGYDNQKWKLEKVEE